LQVSIEHRVLRFGTPIVTAYGTLAERELLELHIEDADGICGHGEAAPLEPYDGVSLQRVRAALEGYATVLEEHDELPSGDLLDACRLVADVPQALAAVDMALWERAGRRAGLPVAALLSDTVLDAVCVNATIGAQDRAGAAAAAEAVR